MNDPFVDELNKIKRLVNQRKINKWEKNIIIYCSLCEKNVQYLGAHYHLKNCHEMNLQDQKNKPKNK
jgi:hypothetical protein